MRNINQIDRQEIVLSGEEWGVTTIYNIPQSNYYHVSIKPKLAGVKDKYIVTFVNKVRAEIFRKGNVNVIKFYKFTLIINENIAETVYSSTQKDMDMYIAIHSKSDTPIEDGKQKKKAKSALAKEIFGGEMTEDEIFGDMDDVGMDMNVTDMLEAWEDFFQEKSADATTKAKNLLLSISNHYLTKKILGSDIYIKNKLVMQAESLSMLFVQLALTKQVLLKLFKEIMSDLGSKSTYEAFAQQQKFVLEINVFLNKTIQDIIVDMKQAKERFNESLAETAREEELAMAKEGGTSLIVTRDRRKMLLELDEMMKGVEESQTDFSEEDVEALRKEKERELNITGEDDFNETS